METVNLTPGQWVEAVDGICQVVNVEDQYFEEFNLESGRNIGEYQSTMVIYKLLADFEGKIKKRDIYRACNASLCNHLSPKSAEILGNIQSVQTESYARFIELRPKRALGGIYEILVTVDTDRVDDVLGNLERSAQKLSEPFNALQLNELTKQVAGLDVLSKRTSEGNLRIVLFNQWFLSMNRRRLFSDVKFLKARVNNQRA